MIIYEVNVSTELENAQMTKNTQNFFDVPACCCSCFFFTTATWRSMSAYAL